MLTDEQRRLRKGRLTASQCGCLMTGDEEKLLKLWRVMTDQDIEDDLSGIWAVQLGVCTEPLNLDWYERKNRQAVSRRGAVVLHYSGLFACTLDGWIDELMCPLECKHVGGREPLEVTIDRYYPQLTMQMELTGASQAALSIIRGADAPLVEFIAKDNEYAAELMRRARMFMRHVKERIPPVSEPPIAPKFEDMVELDMRGSPRWEQMAGIWLQTYKAAHSCKDAEKGLKALMPADARRCYGFGVKLTRDRAGRLSLREDRP